MDNLTLEHILTAIIYMPYESQRAKGYGSEQSVEAKINLARSRAKYILSSSEINKDSIKQHYISKNEGAKEMANLWKDASKMY